MTENSWRKTESVRRNPMDHVEAIEELRVESVHGFARTIDELGEILQPDGNAASRAQKVAEKTGLPVTMVDAFRAKKRKTIPTHIRQYFEQILDAYNSRKERQIEHENRLLRERLAAMHAALTVGSVDPEFHCNEADRVREQFIALGGDETAVGCPDRPVD